MGRLVHLLRQFNLPPTASAAELRQAYLQRVKLVHPDVADCRSTEDFHRLQQRFDEASALLKEREKASCANWGLRSTSFDGSGRAASAAAGWQHRETAHSKTTAGHAAPVVGLPQSAVYPTTVCSLFAAAVASFLFSQRRASSPANTDGSGVKNEVGHLTIKKSSGKKEPIPAPDNSAWPALEPGPWNVPAAKAAVPCNGVWAPSKASEFLDTDCFMAGRARGHMRAGLSQRKSLGKEQGAQVKGAGYEASHQPIVKDGVEMLPVHVAAEDGHVWWLEHCGATRSCRTMLDMGDTREETALHHGARHGQIEVCRALLRLGANPGLRNSEGHLPEDCAGTAGHAEIAGLLYEARLQISEQQAMQGQEGNGDGGTDSAFIPVPPAALKHPDGLGVLSEPCDGVVYLGLSISQTIKRAVNMAAGCQIAQSIPVPRAVQESPDAVDRVPHVVRGSLQGTEYDLEDMEVSSSISSIWNVSISGAEVCGLLLYEAPGTVTGDAPGHWVALRWSVLSDLQASGSPARVRWWRLDPVRGSFSLRGEDVEQLLSRYRAWRMVRVPPKLGNERAMKMASTQAEAVALVKARQVAAAKAAAAAAKSE